MYHLPLLEDENAIAKPFIKWVGGKQALAGKLIEYFPDNFETFYEPFIGGGSVFLNLNPKKAVIADYNNWLVDTYKAVKIDWKKVAKILDALPNEKEYFLKVRSITPSELPLYQRAAHFIYLNKTCFRGLFRVNRKGMFNVPYGQYDRRYYSPENLSQVAMRLEYTQIRQGDFELNLFDVKKGDFIYLDPPYYKVGKYSDFNRYNDKQFSEYDQIRLASVCNELDKACVKWALSNSNSDFIKRLYKSFNVHKLDARREINLNSSSRNIKELLITNY